MGQNAFNKKGIENKKKGGKNMTESQPKPIIRSEKTKREINWAQYLDYTKFFDAGETNNKIMDRYIKDFEIGKRI